MIDLSEGHRNVHESFDSTLQRLASGLVGDPASQIAAVADIVRLADETTRVQADRQRCVDTLCTAVRRQLSEELGPTESSANEIVLLVVATIGLHLGRNAEIPSWSSLSFDFSECHFGARQLQLSSCSISGGRFNFNGSQFTRCELIFDDLDITAGGITFDNCLFVNTELRFDRANFGGADVTFNHSSFQESRLMVRNANFRRNGMVATGATFDQTVVDLDASELAGGIFALNRSTFRETAILLGSIVIGERGDIILSWGNWVGGQLSVDKARIHSGGLLSLQGGRYRNTIIKLSHLILNGGFLNLDKTEFRGGLVSFADTQFRGSNPSLERLESRS